MNSTKLLALICLALALGEATAWAAAPASAVAVAEVPPLVVDAKTATALGWLTLHNPSNAEQAVRMVIGDFVSTTTGRALGTQAEFFEGAATAGTHFVERKLKANETLAVRLQVKNLWEAGESSASLLVNGEGHILKATALDVPFNVTLVAGSADKPALTFERGRGRQMVLKNDDAVTYPVAWKLFVPDEGAFLEGTTTLPAKSTVPIALSPPPAWFRHAFEGLFKDEIRSGLLTVSFAPATGVQATALPTRTVSAELRLAYWSEGWKSSVGNLIILLILVAGGLCSLVLGMSIPNRLARIDLSRSLDALLQDIRAVSSQLPSVLRVALRVERLRLIEAVRKQRTFGADTADQLKKFEREIGVLTRRTQLASRLDDVVRQLAVLGQATSAAPPSRIDAAARAVERAAMLLAKSAAGEAELQAAEALVQDAAARITGIMQDEAEFAKTLAVRIKELRVDFANYRAGSKKEICEEMEKELPDLFEVLKDATLDDATNIPVGKYHWIDTSVEKLFVLRHYILRYQDSQPDQERHKRIAAVKQELVKLLRLQNWNALQLARSLRRQCEQDIFVRDVEAELKKGRARVDHEPLNVYPNMPTRLRVRFTDPRFDECEARRVIRCVWNFGTKVGEEEGWDIVHYFRTSEEAPVKVDFRNPHGADDKAVFQLEFTAPLQEAQQEDWWSDRAKAETGRLLLALAIAVLALLAGAREQLLKLDLAFGLIAVFLMGVGADAIKNLFAKRT